MHKKIVSTCSPNNNMYWVYIQYIVKKFPDGLFLVTPYIGWGDEAIKRRAIKEKNTCTTELMADGPCAFAERIRTRHAR